MIPSADGYVRPYVRLRGIHRCMQLRRRKHVPFGEPDDLVAGFIRIDKGADRAHQTPNYASLFSDSTEPVTQSDDAETSQALYQNAQETVKNDPSVAQFIDEQSSTESVHDSAHEEGLGGPMVEESQDRIIDTRGFTPLFLEASGAAAPSDDNAVASSGHMEVTAAAPASTSQHSMAAAQPGVGNPQGSARIPSAPDDSVELVAGFIRVDKSQDRFIETPTYASLFSGPSEAVHSPPPSAGTSASVDMPSNTSEENCSNPERDMAAASQSSSLAVMQYAQASASSTDVTQALQEATGADTPEGTRKRTDVEAATANPADSEEEPPPEMFSDFLRVDRSQDRLIETPNYASLFSGPSDAVPSYSGDACISAVAPEAGNGLTLVESSGGLRCDVVDDACAQDQDTSENSGDADSVSDTRSVAAAGDDVRNRQCRDGTGIAQTAKGSVDTFEATEDSAAADSRRGEAAVTKSLGSMHNARVPGAQNPVRVIWDADSVPYVASIMDAVVKHLGDIKVLGIDVFATGASAAALCDPCGQSPLRPFGGVLHVDIGSQSRADARLTAHSIQMAHENPECAFVVVSGCASIAPALTTLRALGNTVVAVSVRGDGSGQGASDGHADLVRATVPGWFEVSLPSEG